MAIDNELLREYARSASEAAFAELVQRHVNMVFSTALREVNGDAGLAQELTQMVFVELGRKAASLVGHPVLAGWLYTSVRWTAANARRAEDRRQRRQQDYQTMSELHSSESPEATWQQVRPVIDDSLHELEEKDRVALVLRYFENHSLKEIGVQLGLNENAARMRVDRALERLEEALSKRGITSTRSALAAALVASAIVSAPTGLAAHIATTAVASSVMPLATAKATGSTLLKSTVTAKKLILIASACVLVLGTITSAHFQRFHAAFAGWLHHWLVK